MNRALDGGTEYKVHIKVLPATTTGEAYYQQRTISPWRCQKFIDPRVLQETPRRESQNSVRHRNYQKSEGEKPVNIRREKYN